MDRPSTAAGRSRSASSSIPGEVSVSDGRRGFRQGGANGSARCRRNQSRAALFRQRGSASRQIRLIDEMGQSKCITQYGRMKLTKHTSILSILEKRALRYRARGGFKSIHSGDTIDETGTVDTESLTDSDGDSITSFMGTTIKQSELETIKDVDDDLLKVHGVAPGSKAEGTVRLLYENCNGLNSRMSGNDKLDKS